MFALLDQPFARLLLLGLVGGTLSACKKDTEDTGDGPPGTESPTPSNPGDTSTSTDTQKPPPTAPPLDRTVATNLWQSVDFLLDGDLQVQFDYADDAFAIERIAVVRGTTTVEGGQPASDVVITVVNHPEYGYALSRADGSFDMVVNGGGPLTLDFRLGDLLPAQRTVQTEWQGFAFADPIELVALDPVATVVTSMSATPQIAFGSEVTDQDGTRRAAVVIPSGTQIYAVFDDGTEMALPTATIRATEYTVGLTGPERMPAGLPPSSAYTYAVELSADEALAIGAAHVRFTLPVALYVENFLDLPVGIGVPTAYYDRSSGIWVPSDSGRIISILGASLGSALVDVDGDGQADDPLPHGITGEELAVLGAQFSIGSELWRSAIDHFSPWDLNYGQIPSDTTGFTSPYLSPVDPDCPSRASGSIIMCESQALAEQLYLAGTPFALNYQTNRSPGYRPNYEFDIDVTQNNLPSDIFAIELEVDVAGQVNIFDFYDPKPGITQRFSWDGTDAWGRHVQGAKPARVRVAHFFNANYAQVGRFGDPAATEISGATGRSRGVFVTEAARMVGGWDAAPLGLGGFTISPHHIYDPVSRTLHLGDGRRRTVEGTREISAVPLPDELEGWTGRPVDSFAVSPDGTVFISNGWDTFEIEADGSQTEIANRFGLGTTTLEYVFGVAASEDTVYVGEVPWAGGAPKLYSLNDDTVSVFAGGGDVYSVTEPIPATSMAVTSGEMAVGTDGSIYIVAGAGSNTIVRLTPDGTANPFAGFGTNLAADRVTDLQLPYLSALAVGRDGSVFAATLYQVLRISPGGEVSVYAGSGLIPVPGDDNGDGGPAVDGTFYLIRDLTVSRDGRLLILACHGMKYGQVDDCRVRAVDGEGTIRTIVVGGSTIVAPSSANRAAPLGADLEATYPIGVGEGPDGIVYIATSFSLLKRDSSYPNVSLEEDAIPSADGAELYVFDGEGRHVRTVDPLTGVSVFEFGYADSLLTTITDFNGLVTTIERDAAGDATAVVAPYGQRTELEIGADGYLDRAIDPMGNVVEFDFAPDGLLNSMIEPGGSVHTFTYDGDGRLIEDAAPGGYVQTLTRTVDGNDYDVSLTRGNGTTVTYGHDSLSDGSVVSTFTDAAGNAAVTDSYGASRVLTGPDGGQMSVTLDPEPRYGMAAAVPGEIAITTPGGRSLLNTVTRATTLDANEAVATLDDTFQVGTVDYHVLYDVAAATKTVEVGGETRSTTTLDALGRVVRVEPTGLAPVAFDYDSLGRVVARTVGSGADARITSYTYDSLGYLASTTNPLGETTAFANDAWGRVLSVTRPDGAVASQVFDVDGRLRQVQPPDRYAHLFDYTDAGELERYTWPDGQTSIEYTSHQATAYDLADGRQVTLGYDFAGRQTDLGIAAVDYVTTYGPFGEPSGIYGTDGNAVEWEFDGALLLTEQWSGDIAGAVHRDYDAGFRPASVAVDGGASVNFAYDAAGRLTDAGQMTLTYDLSHHLLASTQVGQVSTSWTYNEFGEPLQRVSRFGGTDLFVADYERDALGRIVEQTQTVLGETRVLDYTYDAVGRLIEVKTDGVTSESYTYDAQGNRIGGTNSAGTALGFYGQSDQILSYGGRTYTHNAHGQRTSETVGGQTTTYAYDELGALRSVLLPDGRLVEYVVDGLGRRVGVRVDGLLVQGFLYGSGPAPIAELDGSGAVVATFVYGTSHVPDYVIRSDGQTLALVTDQAGSVRMIVDASNGVVLQRIDYDTFGRALVDTGPVLQPFGFAGGVYDRLTGMTHMGARDFDASTGRFATRDRIGLSGGDLNLYSYAANDSVNFVDPTGEFVPVLLAAGYAVQAAGLALTASELYPLFQRHVLGDCSAPDVDLGAAAIDLGVGVIPGGRIARVLGKMLSVARMTRGSYGAYELALAGGKHAGTLRNYVGRSLPEIEKAIASYEGQVARHAEKLANPSAYAEDWALRSAEGQSGLLTKWQNDLQRNQELADVLTGLVQSMQ